MAFPKQYLFQVKDQHIGRFARALGHPARALILRMIEESAGMYVHEIVRAVPLHKSTVGAHLQKLRLAGLVDVEERGLYNRYTLNHGRIREMREVQNAFAELLLGETRGKGVREFAEKPVRSCEM